MADPRAIPNLQTQVQDILSRPGIPTSTATGSPTISAAIPGLNDLSQTASGNIKDLLSGLPSASWARTTNAYWGAGAGQPNPGDAGTFAGNRGADLYHLQSQQNRQQGLDDLLKMVQGYSGTVASTPGQIQQNNQFDQTLAQQKANDLWNQLFQEKQLNFNERQALNKNRPAGANLHVTGYDPAGIGAWG
jgi:hypothetical protein